MSTPISCRRLYFVEAYILLTLIFFQCQGFSRHLYSGRGKFMPLPLKSKILETPGSLATDDIKMFLLWIQTLNLQASLIVQYELSKICNFCCYLSPKWTNLVWPFFWRKKDILPLMGGKNFFSTEEKCYLMGWGEYGVKSKDIVARVGPSQRAENM